MSIILSALPLLELLSGTIGVAVASYSFLDMMKSERRSKILRKTLKNAKEWKTFEKTSLKDILSDKRISETEWKIIITKVDELVRTDESIETASIRAIYPSRSEKAKRLLISDMLTHPE